MTIREQIEIKLNLTLKTAIDAHNTIGFDDDESISNTVLNLIRALNELNDEEVK